MQTPHGPEFLYCAELASRERKNKSANIPKAPRRSLPHVILFHLCDLILVLRTALLSSSPNLEIPSSMPLAPFAEGFSHYHLCGPHIQTTEVRDQPPSHTVPSSPLGQNRDLSHPCVLQSPDTCWAKTASFSPQGPDDLYQFP